MAYNTFKKLEQLRAAFGIEHTFEPWLPSALPPTKPTAILEVALKEAAQEVLTTEKAKSESIIAPVLKELRRLNPDRFSYFSGFEFNVDPQRKLNGYCDFILSAQTKQLEIVAPVFCLVETKDDKIERGIAQCAAEMYAAHLFNEEEGHPKKQIFGCVTNAFSWCFLKLEKHHLYVDPNYVPLTFTEPHKVLAVLQWILDESLRPFEP